MSTLMRVRISSDAPRCTVQFGALDPRCTMVQVHGDPNEPSLGAGAAGAPCVTLISGVKDAQRSRRQSIWAVYTSLRHTAKYTGFGCILQVYSRLSSSRLACHAIQRIQPIQPYSHTRHTSYSAIQPPSGYRGLNRGCTSSSNIAPSRLGEGGEE